MSDLSSRASSDGAAARASPSSSREGYFLSSRMEKQGGEGGGGRGREGGGVDCGSLTNNTVRPDKGGSWGCGVSANESSNEGPCPHVGSEFQTTMTGFRPIMAAQGLNLDADWLAAFHRVPSLITFSPLLLTLSYQTGRSCSAHKTQPRTVIAKRELMNDSEAVCF